MVFQFKMKNMRKVYCKVYSICKNLFFKFEQIQAFQGILKILVRFRPSAPFLKKHLPRCFLLYKPNLTATPIFEILKKVFLRNYQTIHRIYKKQGPKALRKKLVLNIRVFCMRFFMR